MYRFKTSQPYAAHRGGNVSALFHVVATLVILSVGCQPAPPSGKGGKPASSTAAQGDDDRDEAASAENNSAEERPINPGITGYFDESGQVHVADYINVGRDTGKTLPPEAMRILQFSGTANADSGVANLKSYAGVTVLDLGKTDLTGAGLKHIAFAKDLERLVLDSTLVTGDDLADLPHFPRLTDLEIDNLVISDQQVEMLRERYPDARIRYAWGATEDQRAQNRISRVAKCLFYLDDSDPRRLGTIDLVATEKFFAGGEQRSHENIRAALTTAAGLDHIRRVRLTGNWVTDQVVGGLDGYRSVTDVDVARSAISDEAVTVIASLPALEIVSFAETQVSDRGVAALATAATLREVNLRDTLVSDEGVRHLEGLQELEQFNLQGLDISDNAVRDLAAALPKISYPLAVLQRFGARASRDKEGRVTRIDLQGSDVRDEHLVHLQSFPMLRDLNASQSKLTDAGMKHLQGLPLERLDVRFTKVTDKGLEPLRNSKLQIRSRG